MKRFLWEASYLATVVLLTAAVFLAHGLLSQKHGALEERAKQRGVTDSLLVVELLQHTDSIVTEVAIRTTYRLQRRRDSVIRARRAACGALLREC